MRENSLKTAEKQYKNKQARHTDENLDVLLLLCRITPAEHLIVRLRDS